MLAAIRVDGNVEIGIGHVIRCLTLAERLMEYDIECVFYVRNISASLYWRISKKFQIISLFGFDESFSAVDEYASWLGTGERYDALEFLEKTSAMDFKFVIVDHYGVSAEWETIVSAKYQHLVVLDDLANRKHNCSIVIDQSIGFKGDEYSALVPNNCVTLLGPKFALLSKNFEFNVCSSLKKYRMLINFGGADKDNYTLHVAQLLERSSLPSVQKMKIVVGKDFPHFKQLLNFSEQSRFDITLIKDPKNMAREISECNFSIGAAGVSLLERSSLGVPSILYIIANNQRRICEEYRRKNLGFLIEKSGNYEIRKMTAAISELCDISKLRQKSDANLKLVDSFGAIRVIIKLLGIFSLFETRNASLADCKFIYKCRYPGMDTSFDISNAEVPHYSQHKVWYNRSLQDARKKQVIYNVGNHEIGYLLLDKHDVDTEVSMYVYDKFRHHNIGSAILRDFCSKSWDSKLFTTVNKKNTALIKTFKGCGFLNFEESGDFVRLMR